MTDPLEERLRKALRQEGDAVQPDDRLGEIRAAARPGHRRRSWALAVAAAAVVAVISVVAWMGLRPSQQALPSLPAPTPTGSSGEPLTEFVLPVYFVAALAPGSDQYALVQYQDSFWLPWNASATQKADVALVAAAQPPDPNPNAVVAAWSQGTVGRVVAHPGVEVDVEVSQPGRKGLPDRVQELAVQALVWTVTDALGEPHAPVMIWVASGGDIFERMPANVYKRPGDDRLAQELAPIWVDTLVSRAPLQGPVVVRGDTCTPQQHVRWELRRGSAVVANGSTTAASASCPEQRGAWSVSLGTLAAGTYEFRAFEDSAKDGGLVAQNVVPFSVG